MAKNGKVSSDLLAELKKRNKPYHAQNPATTVHILVKELLSYIPSVR